MPLILISVHSGRSAASFRTNLIEAGPCLVDAIAFDLLKRFNTAEEAMRLVVPPLAIRGMPSDGRRFSQEENEMLPRMPQSVDSFDDLRSLADEIKASVILAYDQQWFMFGVDRIAEPLNAVQLFKIAENSDHS